MTRTLLLIRPDNFRVSSNAWCFVDSGNQKILERRRHQSWMSFAYSPSSASFASQPRTFSSYSTSPRLGTSKTSSRKGRRDEARSFSTRAIKNRRAEEDSSGSRLTHVTSGGEAHMVDVGHKASTHRTATAVGFVLINPETARLINENRMKKGDVLAVARIAGIMAAKKTSDLVPLCHPVAISKINVGIKLLDHPGIQQSQSVGEEGDVEDDFAALPRETKMRDSDSLDPVLPDTGLTRLHRVCIEATVECVGPTGVEMEALVAVNAAALTVYDMCKAVDKLMEISGVRVVRKEGGRSGDWKYPQWKSHFDNN